MVDKQIQGTLMNVCEHVYYRGCTHFVIADQLGACSAIREMLYPLCKEIIVLIVMFLNNYRNFQSSAHWILEVNITCESTCIPRVHKPMN